MMADFAPVVPTTLPYSKWLLQWNIHMRSAEDTVRVPPEASHITTLLVSHHWITLLADHPDETLVRFFIVGISSGFRIGFNHPEGTLSSAKKI